MINERVIENVNDKWNEIYVVEFDIRDVCQIGEEEPAITGNDEYGAQNSAAFRTVI